MHLEVLRLLVSSRPDAGSPKLRGSPMEVAAKLGDIAAMEVLVQHGADVNGSKGSAWRSDTDPTEPTHARRSPLWMAVGHDRVKAVAWLLQQGISGEGSGLGLALKAAAWQLDTTLMDMLLSYSPTQAVIPRYGPSALLTAVECGHAEAAEELLKAGVPSTAQAIQHAEGLDGERDVRERLRRFLSWDEAYEQSSAILQAAIEHGHADFAQLLREARAAAAAAAGTATRTAAAAPPPAP
jgi:ankyrin repeat protein